jgi:hypothetical protein
MTHYPTYTKEQLGLIDTTPLGLWTDRAEEAPTAPRTDIFIPRDCCTCHPGAATAIACQLYERKCLKCGKPTEEMFCSAKCRTAWTKSMNAFADRTTRTTLADGQQNDFIGS